MAPSTFANSPSDVHYTPLVTLHRNMLTTAFDSLLQLGEFSYSPSVIQIENVYSSEGSHPFTLNVKAHNKPYCQQITIDKVPVLGQIFAVNFKHPRSNTRCTEHRAKLPPSTKPCSPYNVLSTSSVPAKNWGHNQNTCTRLRQAHDKTKRSVVLLSALYKGLRSTTP